MKHIEEPRIFVVEDNLLFQQLIAKELESLSGEIYFFTKGEHCLKALDKRPSIVVLDYHLDGEINGLDTLEAIRKFDDSIFIILFSSQKSVYSRRNISRYGEFAFLEKKNKSFGKLKQTIQAGYLSIP
jgi:two-component system, OmpR family, response regulator